MSAPIEVPAGGGKALRVKRGERAVRRPSGWPSKLAADARCAGQMRR